VKTKILFIANPSDIHDFNWISSFSLSKSWEVFLIVREMHVMNISQDLLSVMALKKITLVGSVNDFALSQPLDCFRSIVFINKTIKKYKIDLLHILYSEPNGLWLLAKSIFKVPSVITTRGSDVLVTIPIFFRRKDLVARIVKKLYCKAFNNADIITSTSANQKQNIVSLLKVAPEKIHLIRTGVDMRLFVAADKSMLPEEISNKKFILFPRLMSPLYQHELAIDAIALLPEFIQKKFTFVFINSDSIYYDYVEMIKTKMNNLPSVCFLFLPLQRSEIIFSMYKYADAVVMSPKSDGSSVSAMEVLACGVPLLLPNLAYDRDIFNEGVTFYKSGNVEDLAKKMIMVFSDGHRKNSPSKNLLMKIDRQYQMSKLSELYVSMLQKNGQENVERKTDKYLN
jgi:glycosyltransferase involved in cell wall biosynthesis